MAVESNRTMSRLAALVREALGAGDLSQYGDLLDANVTWGAPDDPAPSCGNKSQVLRWYERGSADGRRAAVVDVEVHVDKLLVHLAVSDADPAVPGGRSVGLDRWQVLTCARGRVVDIRGFESREEAVARLASRR
jgi:ketosteroid isomerase-like protein